MPKGFTRGADYSSVIQRLLGFARSIGSSKLPRSTVARTLLQRFFHRFQIRTLRYSEQDCHSHRLGNPKLLKLSLLSLLSAFVFAETSTSSCRNLKILGCKASNDLSQSLLSLLDSDGPRQLLLHLRLDSINLLIFEVNAVYFWFPAESSTITIHGPCAWHRISTKNGHGATEPHKSVACAQFTQIQAGFSILRWCWHSILDETRKRKGNAGKQTR